MGIPIQRRGGTTVEHATFTGLAREITVDTTKKTVVVHDGVTAGGHALAIESTIDVRTRGARNDGVTDCRAALAAIASQNIVFPAGTYKINSNLTLTGTVTFHPGAVLKPAAGVTISLHGEIVAGFWQIFDGTLGGAINGYLRNQMILPEWWGGTPNTETNQSPYIQWALNFAMYDNAKTVYLRNGVWRCDEALSITLPCNLAGQVGVPSQGYGAGDSVLDFTHAASNVSGLLIGRTTDFPMEVTVSHIVIARDVLAAKGSGCIGVKLQCVSGSKFSHVAVWNFDRGFVIGGSVAFASGQNIFEDCRVQYAGTVHWDIWSLIDSSFLRCFAGGGTADMCVYIYPNGSVPGPNALHFDGCVFVSDTPEAVRILDGFWLNFENCVFELFSSSAFLVSMPFQDLSLLNVSVKDCWFNNPGTAFSSVGEGGNFRIRDNRIEKNNTANFSAISIDKPSGGATERDIRIDGNYVKTNGGIATTGIFVTRVAGATISNNRVWVHGGAAGNAGITLGTDTTQMIVSQNRSQTTFPSADGVSDNGVGNILLYNAKYT